MVAKIIGVRKFEFEDKTGATVAGANVFATYKAEGENARGTIADKIFVRKGTALYDRLDDFMLDKEYDFIFTSTSLRGKASLTDIKPVSPVIGGKLG